jgi:hypothetical protein
VLRPIAASSANLGIHANPAFWDVAHTIWKLGSIFIQGPGFGGAVVEILMVVPALTAALAPLLE